MASLGGPSAPGPKPVYAGHLSFLQLVPLVTEPLSFPISKHNENTCSQGFSLSEELLYIVGLPSLSDTFHFNCSCLS